MSFPLPEKVYRLIKPVSMLALLHGSGVPSIDNNKEEVIIKLPKSRLSIKNLIINKATLLNTYNEV